jgi:hypothetical protein
VAPFAGRTIPGRRRVRIFRRRFRADFPVGVGVGVGFAFGFRADVRAGTRTGLEGAFAAAFLRLLRHVDRSGRSIRYDEWLEVRFTFRAGARFL